eukprot:TRINITY_DN1683_c0_g8_i5.p1 TRINITY_DN1683_c0_g8~~TRINITY_DN1683_c0_g8_i5.p1  ORF type:complete len:216 (+),score=40.65 TRINITY_DN1683_c0_g8_i5:56-703(+)
MENTPLPAGTESSMLPPPPVALPKSLKPVDAGVFQFSKPSRKIQNPEDLKRFSQSETAKMFVNWLVELSKSVEGKKISQASITNPLVFKVLEMLETLDKWVDETPPIEQPMRFGNKAFRIWLERVHENSEQLMRSILPEHLQDASIELASYFNDSFGNKTRIDYGTGHETNFVAWMYCLNRLQLVGEQDYQCLVLKVFERYIKIQIEHILWWLWS